MAQRIGKAKRRAIENAHFPDDRSQHIRTGGWEKENRTEETLGKFDAIDQKGQAQCTQECGGDKESREVSKGYKWSDKIRVTQTRTVASLTYPINECEAFLGVGNTDT